MWRFIHIPKCGGMSFRSAYSDFERELQPSHEPAFTHHPSVQTVAVIRHPLDRLTSIFHWWRGGSTGLTMRDWIDKGAWRHQPCVALDKVGQIVPVSTAQRKWIRDDTYLIMLDDYQDQADRWAKIAGFPKRDIPRLNMSSRPPHWGLCYTDKQIKNLLRYYHDDLLMWQSLSQYHKQKVEA